MTVLADLSSPRGALRSGGVGGASASDASRTTLKLAALHFDASSASKADGSWRAQSLVRSARSPRLRAMDARPATSHAGAMASGALAALQGKSDAEIVQMLIDNDLNSTTFMEYLQQRGGSPAMLVPWLQTLANLASKVGMLLESSRYLTCDLQLSRILFHIQVSARALVGGKRAMAFLVNAQNDTIYKIGDRGEVLSGPSGPQAAESLSHGTSIAAHCARSAKPLLIGLPGSPHRAGLQFNVDSGSGTRPESCLCVPCQDHLGNVLAVIQVVDKQQGGVAFGRDDLALLQRFAIQCGVSIRNAGGIHHSSAAPTGEAIVSLRIPPRQPTSAQPPSSQAVALGGGSGAGTLAPPPSPQRLVPRRMPRTSDASCQCELLK